MVEYVNSMQRVLDFDPTHKLSTVARACNPNTKEMEAERITSSRSALATTKCEVAWDIWGPPGLTENADRGTCWDESE